MEIVMYALPGGVRPICRICLPHRAPCASCTRSSLRKGSGSMIVLRVGASGLRECAASQAWIAPLAELLGAIGVAIYLACTFRDPGRVTAAEASRRVPLRRHLSAGAKRRAAQPFTASPDHTSASPRRFTTCFLPFWRRSSNAHTCSCRRASEVCPQCRQYRPRRTHHCSACNVCVVRFDHHCLWMGTCIGAYSGAAPHQANLMAQRLAAGRTLSSARFAACH